LPTYRSELNWIEAEFAALRYFARTAPTPQPRRTGRAIAASSAGATP
jgi:hypothetical protein